MVREPRRICGNRPELGNGNCAEYKELDPSSVVESGRLVEDGPAMGMGNSCEHFINNRGKLPGSLRDICKQCIPNRLVGWANIGGAFCCARLPHIQLPSSGGGRCGHRCFG